MSAISRRWYCKFCGERYQPKMGVLVELWNKGHVSNFPAEFTPDDLRDSRSWRLKREREKERHGNVTDGGRTLRFPARGHTHGQRQLCQTDRVRGVRQTRLWLCHLSSTSLVGQLQPADEVHTCGASEALSAPRMCLEMTFCFCESQSCSHEPLCKALEATGPSNGLRYSRTIPPQHAQP